MCLRSGLCAHTIRLWLDSAGSANGLQRGNGGFLFVRFAAMTEHGRCQGQYAQAGAGDKKAQQHQDQGAANFIIEENMQVDNLRILQRKTEKQDEKNTANDGGNNFHRYAQKVQKNCQCQYDTNLEHLTKP